MSSPVKFDNPLTTPALQVLQFIWNRHHDSSVDEEGDDTPVHAIWNARMQKYSSTGLQDTYIAIGSNVGDRVEAFKEAISQLRLLGNVTATSFLYETPPMYVTDQEKFLNAACHLQTSLQPDELLKALKAVG